MKILYAIQGTGNGHLSRAMEIIPYLKKRAEVDLLVSGVHAELKLPYEIKYKFKGAGFVFGKKGGVDMLRSFRSNNILRFIREMNSLPIEKYDLVLNDFEPISAWAAQLKSKKCIALSHQCAILTKDAPQPERKDPVAVRLIKNYAPCDEKYGFHFLGYNKNIFTPIIRSEIRQVTPSNKGHYTVYLPSYDDEILLRYLKEFRGVRWEIFSKHNTKAYRDKNISIDPIDSYRFVRSLASCEGILCGAGFETPAEALYLNKKLMVIPMKHQYEQHCNAEALKRMGVPTVNKLNKEAVLAIDNWLDVPNNIQVDYPDITANVIDGILEKHA